MIGVTWLLLLVLTVLGYSYSWRRHRYWALKGVTTPPFLPFIGHVHKTLIPRTRYAFEDEVYKKYGGSKFSGLYTFHKPAILIGDPELLRHILVKDFDYFADRQPFSVNKDKDKVVANMLTMKNGEEWKKLRAIMTPTFTSGKMKGMYPLVCQKADELISFCLREASEKPYVDMKFNFGRYTMDTIASCAFGIECNSLMDENPIFAKKVEKFFIAGTKMMLRITPKLLFPKLSCALGLRFTLREVDFFEDVATETLSARRKGEKRGDFLDLLLQAEVPNGNTVEVSETCNGTQPLKGQQRLDDLTIVSQSVLFLVAGYDTTASTLAFASYLLAKHPRIQEELRREVKELVQEHGDLTYQGVMEAKLLDSVLMETLRIYPPGLLVERKCRKDYKLPGTDVTIEAGTVVICPLRNIHMDPKYWPEPEEFRPERFLPENKANITNFTHMPFGVGPRNCLAMRFALMEAKVALAKLLLASEVTTAPGYELELDFGFGILRPAKGVHLILNPLQE